MRVQQVRMMRPVFVDCATNTNAQADACVSTVGGDLVRLDSGPPPWDFTPHDAKRLAQAILEAVGERETPNASVRSFETGATRSGDADRYDPEGFLSPLVLERFCGYMNEHRLQPDGTYRDSDNWQRGIPLASYAKSLNRHCLHFWIRHRGFTPADPAASPSIEHDLCALFFNVQGYLHELLITRTTEGEDGS